MRGLLLAILLAGCLDMDLAVEPGQATGTDPAFPDVVLTVDIESTDRFWANATIRNDGDVVTLLGTPPKGCAPSFSFTLYEGERVVQRIPEAICELYSERGLGAGMSESMTFQWDMRPGDYQLEVRIEVLAGEPWGEHPDRAVLVAEHSFTVA